LRKLMAIIVLLVSLGLALGLSWSGGTSAEDAAEAGLYLECPEENWRFGVCVVAANGPVSQYDVSVLRAGWYLDFTWRLNPDRPWGMEYVQMLRVGGVTFPSGAGWWNALENAVLANPGSLWLIGNEPDCIVQDALVPAVYAERFHDVREFIVSRDATAQIAIGAIVQPTPIRLEWLDLVLQEYQARYGVPMTEHVDVWNIHNQIVQEKYGHWGGGIPPGLPYAEGRLYTMEQTADLGIFIQHIRDFRQWMKDRGVQDKPLILSEYGVLMPVDYGFTADRVKDFMVATHTYLLHATDPAIGYPSDGNRLVQRWAWYSLNDQAWDPETRTGFGGSLFEWESSYPGELTRLGQHWVDFMNDQPFPTPTPSTTPPPVIFRREVEDATISRPMIMDYHENASHCYYVRQDPDDPGGAVEMSLYAREAGDYMIWARVQVPDGWYNAMRVVVDDMPEFKWKLTTGHWGWMWDAVSEDGVSDPKVFSFKRGWHFFRFYPWGGDVGLDVLELMKTDISPEKRVEPCATPGVEVNLAPGANLVSFPVAVSDTSVSEVLSSVWDNVSKVYSYEAADPMNPWKVYDKALPPGASTLTDLDKSVGFWIYLDAADTFSISGQFPGRTEFQLYEGANLISYPCMDARLLECVLAPIDGKYTKVYYYDSSDPLNPWRVYDTSLPPGANTLTEFEPGEAYWLYVSEDCTLSIMD